MRLSSRHVLALTLVLALSAARGAAGPLGEPDSFWSASWADASGQDGQGGVRLTVGKNAQGNKILPLRPDRCPKGLDEAAAKAHPRWVVFSDGDGYGCLAFEWTWVTQGEEKYWGKTWGGSGLAFDKGWSSLDVTGAKVLLMTVKASSADLKGDIKLSLNSNGAKGNGRSGTVSLKDFAEGKKLGTDWTRVVLPLAAIPNLKSVDLTSLNTIGIDLGGFLAENQLDWVRFANVQFSDSEILTSPERLGWALVDGKVQLAWDQKDAAGVEEFLIKVDDKLVARAKGALRSAQLDPAAFAGGKGRLSIQAAKGRAASPPLNVEVQLPRRRAARATVTVGGPAGPKVSPLLFGQNNLVGEQVGLSGATINRWGGNRKSRYNWKDDADSAAADWYFLNEAQGDPGSEATKSYYKFVDATLKQGADVNLVVPIGPWVAKRPAANERLCSFPLSLYPSQSANDGQGCGNGILPSGEKIWGNDPARNNVPSDPAFQQAWVKQLVQGFGPAAKGGVKYYSLDNEPGLWPDTHRDVMPKGIGYEQLADLNVRYARAIKQADPSAQVIGFVAWGVKELAGSSLDYYAPVPDGYKRPDKFGPGEERYSDRKKHGDLPLLHWYLQAMKEAEAKEGKRLIDYVDVHWYPETYGKDAAGKTVRLSGDLPYEPGVAVQQFEALREFYDPSYKDPLSWTANEENHAQFWDPFHPLLPALKKAIATYYPGTQLAITEYDSGSRSAYHGGLLRAVALGLFMREGVAMANSWYNCEPSQAVFWAQRLYSGYDGPGSRVAGWSFAAQSSDPQLYAFSAASRDKAYVILVNRSQDSDLSTALKLPWPVAKQRSFLLCQSGGAGLMALPPKTGAAATTVTVPAWSAVLAELSLNAR